jgi:hypothetical protein
MARRFFYVLILSFCSLPWILPSARAADSDTPTSVMEDADSGGDPYNKRAEELNLYNQVKNKEWNQMTGLQRMYMRNYGVNSEEKYQEWKEDNADAAAEAQYRNQLPIYNRVKSRRWSQLSSQEKAYASRSGIKSEAQYDAWKDQMEASGLEIQAKQDAARNAQIAAEQLVFYKQMKGKSWGKLTAREKALAGQYDIHSQAEYDQFVAEHESPNSKPQSTLDKMKAEREAETKKELQSLDEEQKSPLGQEETTTPVAVKESAPAAEKAPASVQSEGSSYKKGKGVSYTKGTETLR